MTTKKLRGAQSLIRLHASGETDINQLIVPLLLAFDKMPIFCLTKTRVILTTSRTRHLGENYADWQGDRIRRQYL